MICRYETRAASQSGYVHDGCMISGDANSDPWLGDETLAQSMPQIEEDWSRQFDELLQVSSRSFSWYNHPKPQPASVLPFSLDHLWEVLIFVVHIRFLSCQNCYIPYQTLANLVCSPRLNRLLLIDCEFSAYSSSISALPETLSLSQLSFERSRIDSTPFVWFQSWFLVLTIAPTATALEAIVSRLINVTDLNLSACEVRVVLASLPPQSIYWSSVDVLKKLSADVLDAIGERCRSLQVLNISHTNITAQDITQLLRKLLRSFVLEPCSTLRWYSFLTRQDGEEV